MESDCENDDGASCGDESESEGETDDIAEEVHVEDEEEADDPLFDACLIDAVGGLSSIASGTISADILKDMSISGWAKPASYSRFPYLYQPYESRTLASVRDEYPGLYKGEYGPSASALEAASSVSGALFYNCPPRLWETIAEASNEYFDEKINERVESQYEKQKEREKKNPGFTKSSRAVIKASLLQTSPITARELCVFVGHLIARTISPNKGKIENHWKPTDEGAIPRGHFGLFMTRNRFIHISWNLHFNSNSDPRAATDRAWKLRSVIDVLQARFKAGYVAPPDEAMLPSRSSFNKLRVYMKDKPHKWGGKLFMLCCSASAYCIRFKVYYGKRQSSGTTAQKDTKSGPAAVIRNLIEVFGTSGPAEKRLIVTDRFYTSPALVMQLLALGFYSIGTVVTNRRSLCVEIIVKKTQPASVGRGTYTVVQSTLVPSIHAVRWWDNRPVHVLCAGGSVEQDRVVLRDKSGEGLKWRARRY